MKKICKFANFAKLSYLDFADTKKLTFINDKELEYYIYKDLSTLWIAFRGTDSITDLKTDMFFVKKSVHAHNVKVHSGFLNTYSKHRDNIFSHIDSSITNINITGHSLGGAIALLCSIDIANTHPNIPLDTIVFASPRVGNKNFRKYYNSLCPNTICVVNSNDPIPSLPPSIFGFCKVGLHLFIGNISLPFYYNLKDHSMDNYLAHLDCKNFTTYESPLSLLNKLKSTYKI